MDHADRAARFAVCRSRARPPRRRLSARESAGLGATGGALADAAATDAGADVGAGAPYNLAEVVVTSRRREETLQDVPLAETVRTGAELEQQSAVLFEDAVQGVPNTLAFKSARSVSALEITMRGQTAIPSSIVYDPAVGLYINGVYVAEGRRPWTLLDVDNVEIVRGTQGTLFGRNNTGGSVSIHTRAPQLDSYAGEFALAGGNDGLFGARAIVNVPIASTLACASPTRTISTRLGQQSRHRAEQFHGSASLPGAREPPVAARRGLRCRDHLRALPRQRGRGLLHPLPGTLAAMIPGTRCRRTSTRPTPASCKATSP